MAFNEKVIAKGEFERLVKRSREARVVFAAGLVTVSGKTEALFLPRDRGTLAEAAVNLRKLAREASLPLQEGAIVVGSIAQRDKSTKAQTYRLLVGKQPSAVVKKAVTALFRPRTPVFVTSKRGATLQKAINLRFLGTRLQEFSDNTTVHAESSEALGPVFRRFESVLDASWSLGLEDVERVQQKAGRLVAQVLEKLGEEQQQVEERRDTLGKRVEELTGKEGSENELKDAKKAYEAAKKAALRVGRFIDKVKKYRDERLDTLAESLRAVFDDPGIEMAKKHISLSEAVRIKAAGVNFTDVEFDRWNDEKRKKDVPPRTIGSGAFNAPQILTYEDGEGREVKRVYKVELDFNVGKMEKGLGRVGISSESPRFGNRNIVASKIARALGSDVIPKVTYGVHEGKVGIMMELAPGTTGKDFATNAPKLNAKQLASLLERLNELEWADVLAAQTDRNSANYLIDIQEGSVSVTGIDNDLSLGRKSTKIDREAPSVNLIPSTDLIGLPLAKRIAKLDFGKDLRPGMTGRLSDEEIQAAEERLKAAKLRVAELANDKCVVTDWVKWRKDVQGKSLGAAHYLIWAARKNRKQSSLFAADLADRLIENGTIEKESK